MNPAELSEFREMWFPCPRIRLPELAAAGPVSIEGGRCISGALGEYTKLWISAEGPVRVLHLVGDVTDVTRAIERDEETQAGLLGWKLKMTHVIAQGSFHGL